MSLFSLCKSNNKGLKQNKIENKTARFKLKRSVFLTSLLAISPGVGQFVIVTEVTRLQTGTKEREKERKLHLNWKFPFLIMIFYYNNQLLC